MHTTKKSSFPNPIIKADLLHFPTDERFAQIPGKLVLTDNLNEEWNKND